MNKHLTAPRVAVAVVAGVAAVVLAVQPAQAMTVGASASDLAKAMEGTSGLVTGASFATQADPEAAGVATEKLAGFPRTGGSYSVLSTGQAAAVTDSATSNSHSFGKQNPERGDSVHDATTLKVDVNVPSGDNCLAFDFVYASKEYPTYVGKQYNDAFIAELDSSTWSTSGASINAPKNFAFDTAGKVMSVNAQGVGGFSNDAASGMGSYATDNGATKLLTAATSVTPGAHSVYLSIFDQGDGIFDSAVLIDGLRTSHVDNAADCKAGAQIYVPPTTPTKSPTATPTKSATATPTKSATATPTGSATATPTTSATVKPSETAKPTVTPSQTATVKPSETAKPTQTPTVKPSESAKPTTQPSTTAEPTVKPSTPADGTDRGVPAHTGDN